MKLVFLIISESLHYANAAKKKKVQNKSYVLTAPYCNVLVSCVLLIKKKKKKKKTRGWGTSTLSTKKCHSVTVIVLKSFINMSMRITKIIFASLICDRMFCCLCLLCLKNIFVLRWTVCNKVILYISRYIKAPCLQQSGYRSPIFFSFFFFTICSLR